MRAKNENIENNQGISISKLHRQFEGKIICFFIVFWGFVIRPQREADFTPSIFTKKCTKYHSHADFSLPRALDVHHHALGGPWDPPWDPLNVPLEISEARTVTS